MPEQLKILLVEDDPSCRLITGLSLVSAGYRVIELPDGVGVTEVVRAERPALVILDVQMPNRDGWEALADLRQHGHRVPVLMLTACVELEQRIRGLREGADDYVAKGCDLGEFLARVHALLRRAEILPFGPRWLRFGRVTVDLECKAAWRDGEVFTLTRTEYGLLELFAQNMGKPVSREMMLERVWGFDNRPATHTIDTHLWRLRKKIGGSEQWLRNLPGLGYVITCETGEPARRGTDCPTVAA